MEGPVDPQIKTHLECLNSASERINVLENLLTEKRNQYRTLLTESTRHLNVIAKRIAENIAKARPYFEAKKQSEEALQEAQKAAIRFERAVSMHNAAREMVTVAEQAMVKGGHDVNNTAWPEMLNHANLKVNEAEKETLESEVEHQKRAEVFKDAEKKVKNLERKLKSHIAKSRGYFESKEDIHKKLQILTIEVSDVDESLNNEKKAYSKALLNLESISESIHAARRSYDNLNMEKREPGVGAETIVPNTSERPSLPGRSKSESSDLTVKVELCSTDDESHGLDNITKTLNIPPSPKHRKSTEKPLKQNSLKEKQKSPTQSRAEVVLTVAGLSQVSNN